MYRRAPSRMFYSIHGFFQRAGWLCGHNVAYMFFFSLHKELAGFWRWNGGGFVYDLEKIGERVET